MTAERPTVAVLLATFNGITWLPEQLRTILDQEGVTVRVIASDDGSTDGTREWLAERAAADARLVVLPAETPTGSAAGNFFRLIERADLDGADFVAFADQDDLWHPGKLARHAQLLTTIGADAVSSNVTAFYPDGKRELVRKNFPQRDFDYLTEGPGPGCSFLITPRLLQLTRDTLRDEDAARRVDFHDSLIYAIGRGRGWGWHIDDWSSLDYRQHGGNVFGANQGVASARSRLRLIREKWHRNQAIAMARVALHVAPESARPGIRHVLGLMTTPGPRARFALARSAGSFRRRPRDRVVIGALMALGVW